MRVKLTSRQQKILALGAGMMLGGVAWFYVLGPGYDKHKAAMARIDDERAKVFTAAGIVSERIRQGQYKTPEEAHTDFDFERIRLMEEGSNL